MDDILNASQAGAADASASPRKKREKVAKAVKAATKNGASSKPKETKKPTPTKRKATPQREPEPRVLPFHKSPKSQTSDDHSDDGEEGVQFKGRKRLYKQSSAADLGELGEETPEPAGGAKKTLARRKPVASSQVSARALSGSSNGGSSGAGSSRAEIDAPQESDESEEEEEEEEEEGEEVEAPKRRDGGKGAKVTPKRPPKKVAKKSTPADKPEPRQAKIQTPGDEGEGRRSGRARTAPVEFWNHEKPVYNEEGRLIDVAVDRTPVESAAGSARKKPKPRREEPKPKPKPKAQPNKEKPAAPKPKKRRAVVIDDEDDEDGEEEEDDDDDEAGLSDEGFVQDEDPLPVVRDRLTGQDTELRIVKSAAMLDFREMEGGARDANGSAMIATAFGTSAWSSSVIVVPAGSKTAVSESENQLKTCVVLSGQVQVSVHRSHFVMKSGGMFYIPAGNVFRLENMSLSRPARIAMSEFALFDDEA